MEEQIGEVKKPGAPSWAVDPFEDFVHYTERLSHLLRLSTKGISVIRAVPGMLLALQKAREETGEDSNAKLEQAKKEAELAQKEVDEDFPILHAQYVITLWSSLEALVRLFVARWLQNYKPAMETKAIQKLQVKIGEYESLEGEDRYFYIVDRLEQELSTPLKSGVTRFENLLEPFGLSGQVDESVRRDLFELNQIRNVLVHRSGVADRRFVEACPWMNLRVGDVIKIDRFDVHRYFEAVHNYIVELVTRVGECFGVDMRGEA